MLHVNLFTGRKGCCTSYFQRKKVHMPPTQRILLMLVVLTLSGCRDETAPIPLQPSREDRTPTHSMAKTTSAQRFGYSNTAAPGIPKGREQTAPSKGLTWTAPESWIQGPPRPMREVTFFLDQSRSTECYVSLLQGDAGGDAANLNRWCGQMEHSPMDSAQLAALPRIPCLGLEAPLLVLKGTYRGMGRSAAKPNSLFAGTMARWGTQTVFIRMVGPESVASPMLDAFKRFCASIHETTGSTDSARP